MDARKIDSNPAVRNMGGAPYRSVPHGETARIGDGRIRGVSVAQQAWLANPLVSQPKPRMGWWKPATTGLATKVILAGASLLSSGCDVQTIGQIGTAVVILAVAIGVPLDLARLHRNKTQSYYDVQQRIIDRYFPSEFDLLTKGFTRDHWQKFVGEYVVKKHAEGNEDQARQIAFKYGVDWDDFVAVRDSMLTSEIVHEILYDGFDTSLMMANHAALARTVIGLRNTLPKDDSLHAATYFDALADASVGFTRPVIGNRFRYDTGYSQPFGELIGHVSHYLKTGMPLEIAALHAYLSRFYGKIERFQRSQEMGRAYRALFGKDGDAIIKIHKRAIKALDWTGRIEDRIVYALHQYVLSYVVENEGYVLTSGHYRNAPQKRIEEAYRVLGDPYMYDDPVLGSLGVKALASQVTSRRNDLNFHKYLEHRTRWLGSPSMENPEPAFDALPKPPMPTPLKSGDTIRV